MKPAERSAHPLIVAVVSLLVSSCQTIDGQQQQQEEGGYGCPEDEYYDGVVDQCQKCKNVCQPLISPPPFCITNCPEYHRRMLMQLLKDKEQQENSASKNSQEPQQATPSGRIPVAEPQLLQHPLLWISVGCLMVAVMATVAIVVLLVVCRPGRPGQRGDVLLPGSNQSSPPYSRSTSESSTGDQEKKGLVRPDVTSVACGRSTEMSYPFQV
jgi:hypothetical protein